MQFTIRDILWLITVVAILLSAYVRESRLRAEVAELRSQLGMLQVDDLLSRSP